MPAPLAWAVLICNCGYGDTSWTDKLQFPRFFIIQILTLFRGLEAYRINPIMKKTALTLLLFVFIANIYAQNRGFVTKRIEAKDHIALIIGNSNYPDMPLENPKNDANSVAQAFKEMGFIVEKIIDADKEQMSIAINRFSNKLKTASVAVFYFAGHGMQVDGENYLIPIGRTTGAQITKQEQKIMNLEKLLLYFQQVADIDISVNKTTVILH